MAARSEVELFVVCSCCSCSHVVEGSESQNAEVRAYDSMRDAADMTA